MNMWLIVILISTVAVSTIYLLFEDYRKKYKLGLLALMLLGTVLMVFVDHLISFISGEPFIEFATDGLIKSGTLLGIAMIIPIFIIWIIAISISSRNKHRVL